MLSITLHVKKTIYTECSFNIVINHIKTALLWRFADPTRQMIGEEAAGELWSPCGLTLIKAAQLIGFKKW